MSTETQGLAGFVNNPGFRLDFSRRLLERLREMIEKKEVFLPNSERLSDDAVPVVYYLADQVRYCPEINWYETVFQFRTCKKEHVSELFGIAKRFLKVFDLPDSGPKQS